MPRRFITVVKSWLSDHDIARVFQHEYIAKLLCDPDGCPNRPGKRRRLAIEPTYQRFWPAQASLNLSGNRAAGRDYRLRNADRRWDQ